MEEIRLNRYIAQCGEASRREADQMIASGRVKVNGVVASMGMKVTGEEEIVIDNKKKIDSNRKVVLAYYKPLGVTCTHKDEHAKVTVEEALKYPIRLTYAGRLDKNSEGLLLMTNDGELIDKMMRAANRHEKEYKVTLAEEIPPKFIEQMQKGVYLKELDVQTRPCTIEQTGKKTFTIILTQGYNRQIRRMCETCGCRVERLKRIRVMNIVLGTLHPGEYREIGGSELTTLYKMAEQ